jgi:hypothetical protein
MGQQTNQQDGSESPTLKKVYGKPFTKGDARIKQNMERAEREAAGGNGDAAVSADVKATLLEDMRHVRCYSKAFDRTPAQRDVRRWKERDIRSFLTTLADLEKTFVRQGEKPAEQAEDEGEMMCVELVERLLLERSQHSGRGE